MTGTLALADLARELLDAASAGQARRSVRTVIGGHENAMRQTLIALLADASLVRHDSPGEATLYVISGSVTLKAGADSWDGGTGDLIIIPEHSHSIHALEDSVLLLTQVPREHVQHRE